jgi:hypothetical protein
MPRPEIRQALAVLPDLQVVATGILSPADRILLETFAAAVREDVWQIDLELTLVALAAGRTIAEITQFLESASGASLPETATEFFADAQDRIGAIRDDGPARLIRCRDGELAGLLSQGPATHKTCQRVSEHVLVVPARAQAAFLRGLRELGYVLPDQNKVRLHGAE